MTKCFFKNLLKHFIHKKICLTADVKSRSHFQDKLISGIIGMTPCLSMIMFHGLVWADTVCILLGPFLMLNLHS